MRNESASIIECMLKIHENIRLGKVLMETQNKKKVIDELLSRGVDWIHNNNTIN